MHHPAGPEETVQGLDAADIQEISSSSSLFAAVVLARSNKVHM